MRNAPSPFSPMETIALQLVMHLDELATETIQAILEACQKTLDQRNTEAPRAQRKP